MFPAVLSSAAVLGLMALSGSTMGSTVYLETTASAVEVGDLFPVVIYTSATVPVDAIELTVSFPADKVDVFGVDRGQSVLSLWTEDPILTDTSVLLRGGTFQRGFLGKHQIATINFRAKTAGQYEIAIKDLRLVAGDGQGTEVIVNTVPAGTLSVFNFDENTSEEQIRIAVSQNIVSDINGDGEVTLQDISAFMDAWSNRSALFDFNGDGRMTFRDFSIILSDFFFQ